MKTIPKKSDRIAIIGAGPAGVHMAYLLNKHGYEHINLFEKNNRIGGKSYSISHDDTIHEMGSCYISSSYVRTLELMEELGCNSTISIEANMRQAVRNQELITTQSYVLNNSFNIYKNSSHKNKNNFFENLVSQFPIPGNLIKKLHMRNDLIKNINNYIKFYDQIYSNSPYAIPQKSNEALIKKLENNMKLFLKNENFELLHLIFFMMHTVMCYGYPETIHPYYGVYWMSKFYLDAYAKFIMKTPSNINSAMLPEGFQNLWEKAARASGAKIKYESKINKIERQKNNIKVFYDKDSFEEFDFLISAIPAQKMLSILDDPTEEEKTLFSCLNHSIVVTTLIEIDSPHSNQGIIYWFDNLCSENQDKVFASRTAASILQQRFSNKQTAVAYQYYDDCKTFDQAKSEEHFSDSFNQANIKIKKIITREIWPYFYRYKAQEIEMGLPWKIDKIQGQNNTWYIGSSVCFESVDAVINFNHYLVDSGMVQIR